MKAEIKDGNLILTLPIAPRTSKSGKSTVIATTGGNITCGVDYEGQPVTIGVNAYVKK